MSNEMSFEDSSIIKNFARGKEGFKEQAILIYKKYKELNVINIEMQYMEEVLNPIMDYTKKEILRGKLLNIKDFNKKERIY